MSGRGAVVSKASAGGVFLGEVCVGEALASTLKEGPVEAKASPTLFPSRFSTPKAFSIFLPARRMRSLPMSAMVW